jgi:Uncharacterized protein conserved in archaea
VQSEVRNIDISFDELFYHLSKKKNSPPLLSLVTLFLFQRHYQLLSPTQCSVAFSKISNIQVKNDDHDNGTCFLTGLRQIVTIVCLGCIQPAFRDAKVGLGEYQVRMSTNG